MNFQNIKAVIKKELKGYFNHPLGYILLAVFLGLGNFFFFRTVFVSGEASLRPFFELLPWFLLFLVPAATMKALAAEQKEGTIEVVLAQPISEIELIAGKFLGNWIFVLIAIGITLTLPLTLSLGGKLDYGTVFAQYLGAIFLSGGMVAVGLLSSAVTKNQTVAFIVGLFSCFALIIFGFDVVVLGLPYPLNDIFAELSILRHFQNITRGVIDIRDIFYLLSLIFIFLSITYLVFMARKLNRKSKKYTTLQTGLALMIAIAVVINFFGAFLSFRMDFTEQKLYSLSDGTLTVLRGLDDVVTVKLYASRELPSQISLLYRDVKDMLQDYKNASRGKLQLIQKFPGAAEDKTAQEAQQQGIQPVQFNVLKSDEFQVKEGYLGISLQYGDEKEAIPFVQTTDDLEYQLTSLIRKISTNEQKKIVFTSGHGEKDINQDLADFNQVLSKQYSVEAATNKELARKLRSADVAIIAGPKQKFGNQEKAALANFINNGKSVLFLIDTVDVNMQYLFASLNTDSSADLAEQFGVRVNKDLVYDLKSNEQVPFGGPDMSYILPYPFWPKLAANPQNIITSRLKQVVIPWASSVELVEGKLGKAKVEPLLQTSQYAGHQTSNFNVSPDPKNNPLPQKGLKQFVMGYALKNVGQSGKGRLIVLGDSDFLSKDMIARNPQAGGLILNSIDWLGQDELLIGIRSKNSQPRQLLFKSDLVKNFVRYFNMVGLVVIVIGYGLWRMNKRRKMTAEVYV